MFLTPQPFARQLVRGRRRAIGLVGLVCAVWVLSACAPQSAQADYHPFLHQLTPAVVSRGEVLTILGSVRGPKIVALNLNGMHRAEVTRWTDGEVRVRVPGNLPAGQYRVLVYYDDSLATSSNSQRVRLGRVDPPVARRQPAPPARAARGRQPR